MGVFGISLAVISGICLGTGLFHVYIGLRRRGTDMMHLTFGTFALAYGAAVLTAPPLGQDLARREREVLALLVEGLSNAEIAASMHFSVAAVKYHVSGILSRLGAANRTEAAALAREHGLLAESSSRKD